MAVLDYIELPVGAVDQELTFYSRAFAWKFTSYGPDYAAHEEGPCQLALNGVEAGGHRTAAILPVIRVEGIEAARDAVTTAGGTITLDIFEFPGGRRFHFTDPDGRELGCYEPTPG